MDLAEKETPLAEDRGRELLDRAKALTPLLAANAEKSEALGRIADEVVEALDEAGIWGLWVPRSLGGSELAPTEAGRVIEQLAGGDASTAWVVFANACINGSAGAYYGEEAVAQMFGDGIPRVAGHGTKPGVAVPRDGGYEVSGDWSFGSGLKHAQWTHNLVYVEGDGRALICSTPVAAAALDLDSWQTIGLRATGSIDYTIEGAFVPEAFTHPAGITSSERGGPLYELGVIGLICCAHAAWANGVGRRLLDELKKNVAAKAGRSGSQAQSTAFLDQYQVAEARQRSATALFYRTWEDVEATLYAGGALSKEQETLIRLALTNATWSNDEVAKFVYTVGGTAAARPGPIQRGFRDMETGIQHITSGPSTRQNVARSLLGLADDKRWAFMDLVD